MGVLYPIDVAQDVAYALIEPVINTTLGTNLVGTGSQTITVPALLAVKLYVGAQLVIGVRGVNIEVVPVTAVSATTFTGTFANTHAFTDPVRGAMFSSGAPTFPLWTQAEVLEYLAEAQNDFLLRVQPIITTATVNISVAGGRIYDQPNDCVRIERQSIAGQELLETSQSDLDFNDPTWQSKTGTPKKWYQDQLNNAQFGVYPFPDNSYASLLYYSQRAAQTLGFLDAFLVPDVFTYILKYGVLARCWGKDGEGADGQRAAYAQKRFDFGCFLALKFMANALVVPQHRAAKGGFKPMARPQVQPDQGQDQQPNPLMFGSQQ